MDADSLQLTIMFMTDVVAVINTIVNCCIRCTSNQQSVDACVDQNKNPNAFNVLRQPSQTQLVIIDLHSRAPLRVHVSQADGRLSLMDVLSLEKGG